MRSPIEAEFKDDTPKGKTLKIIPGEQEVTMFDWPVLGRRLVYEIDILDIEELRPLKDALDKAFAEAEGEPNDLPGGDA